MPSIYGFGGMLLVFALKLYPFIYMYVSGALKKIDVALSEAAESLGCVLPQSSEEAIIIYFRIIVILLNLIIMLLNLECYSVISVIVNSILLRSNVMRYLPSLAGFMLSPFWSLR